ncbi:MAG TPA: 3-hydroxyacyl-CoA dehydrogenase NAD-binding domain-containing protein [archaeon]|nr:3-hydroxyacyl-CoA dehydrogenase NAD-binding domain-containing protein [archaeon]
MEESTKLVIDKVAVIGTKKKAQQIAETVSSASIEVVLLGENEEQTERALKGISDSIDREIQRWGMTESDKRAILARIHTTTNVKDLGDCKVFIEAVGTTLEEKRKTLQQLEEYSIEPELYIIHINILSVTEIAANSKLAPKVIGMHFLEPVPKIPVVELIRGMHTDDWTVAVAMDFARRIGKTSVEVFEYPGYITNRVILPMINEAIYVLMEGISSAEEIDIAIKLGFNLPMGPLAMADTIGLDEVLRRMESLFHELGDLKYRPCPLLRKMVRAGRLGRSAGEGFFKYEKKEEDY